MGAALKKRMEMGFTFLKMDLGLGVLHGEAGAVNAPLGYLEETEELHRKAREAETPEERRYWRNRCYDRQNIAHPFTCVHITEKGFDLLENYVREVREVIGYEIPLAIDHFGHIGVEDCIKLCRRIEKYNIAWAEDMIPWQLTNQYVRLSHSTTCLLYTSRCV